MRLGFVADGESSSEISSKVIDFFDVIEELRINFFLDSSKFLSPYAFVLLALLGSATQS
jgi:hypothetical protein